MALFNIIKLFLELERNKNIFDWIDFKQLAKLPFSFPFLFFHLTTLNHLIYNLIIFIYFHIVKLRNRWLSGRVEKSLKSFIKNDEW